MCSGGGGNRARRDAERRQREADREAERRERELEALAAQRSAIAAKQRNQMLEMQARQQRLMDEQSSRAASLKSGYEQKVADLQATTEKQIAAKQKQNAIDLYNLNTTNNAVTSSLQILGQGTRKQGPTAQTSKRTRKSRGAQTTQASLKIGSQANTSGANFST